MLYRRSNQRIPIRLFITQVKGQEHWVGMTFNLSVGGLYLCQRPQPIPGEMGIELALPGLEEESIWTKGEVRFVGNQGGFMGIGVAFTAMANKHHRQLHDWVDLAHQQLRPRDQERRSTIRQLRAAA